MYDRDATITADHQYLPMAVAVEGCGSFASANCCVGHLFSKDKLLNHLKTAQLFEVTTTLALAIGPGIHNR